MEDKQIKIQIYQIRDNAKRINADIFNKLKTLYKIELHKITLDELEEITDKKIHLLIFDTLKPSKIDVSLIDIIQKNNKHLYTMFVSNQLDEQLSTTLYENNVDYLCNGNFNDQYIFSLLKTILKRKSSKYFIETTAKYKDIKIDCISHEVFVSNKLIETSKKEFKLIRFLVQHNDEFISKADIFKKIWGYDEDVSRTMDQYLYRIKKKIGENVMLIKDKNGRVKMF